MTSFNKRPPAVLKQLRISVQSGINLTTKDRHIVEPLIHPHQSFTRVVLFGVKYIEFFVRL